jgi:uncharacterized protein (TIGR03000 family)
MRQTQSSLKLSKQRILAVVTLAVLTAPGWADINVRNLDPLALEKDRLKAAGWTGNFGPNLPVDAYPDKAELLNTANQLVGSSADSLPREIAGRVSPAMKDEIARSAAEAFVQAILDERPIAMVGQTGSLRYKVGVVGCQRDTYVGGSKIATAWGLAPFVALLPAERARNLEAEITVEVRSAEAQIIFDGEPTDQTGYTRKFSSPPLEVGKNYEYEIVAQWQENGKEVKRVRKVSLTGGDVVRFDFSNQRSWIKCKWTRYTGERKKSETCVVAYSPDRKRVLKALDTGKDTPLAVRLYDAATEKPLGPKIVHLRTIPVKDPATGKRSAPESASHHERVIALTIAADGKTIATTLSVPDSTYRDVPSPLRSVSVEVWDATSGERVGCYMGRYLRAVFELTFLQHGKYLLISAILRERE